MSWRKSVPSSIKNHLEFQIKESSKYKPIYSKSKNPSNAQLWIAVSNLSRQIFDLNLKLNYLEGVFRENMQKPAKKPTKKVSLKHLKKY